MRKSVLALFALVLCALPLAAQPDVKATYVLDPSVTMPPVNQLGVTWWFWRPSIMQGITRTYVYPVRSSSELYGQINSKDAPTPIPTELHWDTYQRCYRDPITRQYIPITLQPGD